MSDLQYQKQLGIVDEKGELTQEAKINTVHSIVKRFGYSRRDCENALRWNEWSVEAAIDYFKMNNDNVYEYVNKHSDQISQMINPANREEAAKFAAEHPGVVTAAKAVETASKVGSGVVAYGTLAVFIIILACFGL